MPRQTDKKHRQKESGNAFFIVMITVVLFAALMFTFSRGARQGGNNLSEKQAEIAASDIINYVQMVERAVGRVYSKGLSENAISFENNFVSGYTNANCANDRCRVFQPSGGAAVWRNPDTAVSNGQPWVFSGENTILGIGVNGRADLVMLIPTVDSNVCAALNDALDVATPTADADGIETATLFQGVFNNTEQIGGASLTGVNSACIQSGTDFVFYHVLLAR